MLKFLPRIVAVLLVPCLATGQLRPPGAVRTYSQSIPELFSTQTLTSRAAEAWDSWRSGHASIKRAEAYAGGFPNHTLAMVDGNDSGSSANIGTTPRATEPSPPRGLFDGLEPYDVVFARETRERNGIDLRTVPIESPKEQFLLDRFMAMTDSELEAVFSILELPAGRDKAGKPASTLWEFLRGDYWLIHTPITIQQQLITLQECLTLPALNPERVAQLRRDMTKSWEQRAYLRAVYHRWAERVPAPVSVPTLKGPPAMMRKSKVGENYDAILATRDQRIAQNSSRGSIEVLEHLLLDYINKDAPRLVDFFYFEKVIEAHRLNLELRREGKEVDERGVEEAVSMAWEQFFADHDWIIGSDLHWRLADSTDTLILETLFRAIQTALDSLSMFFVVNVKPAIAPQEFAAAGAKLVIGMFEAHNNAFTETQKGVPAVPRAKGQPSLDVFPTYHASSQYPESEAKRRIEMVRRVLSSSAGDEILGVMIIGSTAKNKAFPEADLDFMTMTIHGNGFFPTPSDILFARTLSEELRPVRLHPLDPIVIPADKESEKFGPIDVFLSFFFVPAHLQQDVKAFNMREPGFSFIRDYTIVARDEDAEKKLKQILDDRLSSFLMRYTVLGDSPSTLKAFFRNLLRGLWKREKPVPPSKTTSSA